MNFLGSVLAVMGTMATFFPMLFVPIMVFILILTVLPAMYGIAWVLTHTGLPYLFHFYGKPGVIFYFAVIIIPVWFILRVIREL